MTLRRCWQLWKLNAKAGTVVQIMGLVVFLGFYLLCYAKFHFGYYNISNTRKKPSLKGKESNLETRFVLLNTPRSANKEPHIRVGMRDDQCQLKVWQLSLMVKSTPSVFHNLCHSVRRKPFSSVYSHISMKLFLFSKIKNREPRYVEFHSIFSTSVTRYFTFSWTMLEPSHPVSS